MKTENQEQEQEEIKAPKGAERFTVKAKQVGKYAFGQAYDFGGQLYRLVAVMNNGDGVSLEFVRVNDG